MRAGLKAAALVALGVVMAPSVSDAQQSGKVWRVGVMATLTSSFVTTFFSSVAEAARSFSAEGPTIVPASSRIIQSFAAMLSGWIGT